MARLGPPPNLHRSGLKPSTSPAQAGIDPHFHFSFVKNLHNAKIPSFSRRAGPGISRYSLNP